MTAWRVLALGAAVAAVALASHWLMLHSAERPWGALAITAPLLVGLAAMAVRRRHLGALLGCIIAAVLLGTALSAALASGEAVDLQRLYVLQHAGAHAALAATFGLTLRTGHTALITRMGETVHEHFTPDMRAYTRRLTVAWTAYFVAMVVLSLALYVAAPWRWWSLFANVLTPLSAGLFFVGEHLLRYLRHPEFERIDLRRTVAAWRQRHAGGAAAAPQTPPPSP
ncbi:MAG: hypothetical protein ABI696_04870 [Rubrivivax sp.]